jgi:hypothetical protein
MRIVVEFIAVLQGNLYTGAAVHVTPIEHPARLACDTKTTATVWAPSYTRATVMQASLALIGVLGGTAAWLLGAGSLWLAGAVLLGWVVPFTLIAIMRTNHHLLAPWRDLGSSETRALLEKWGKLHAVRSVLSFLAPVVFICLLLRVNGTYPSWSGPMISSASGHND